MSGIRNQIRRMRGLLAGPGPVIDFLKDMQEHVSREREGFEVELANQYPCLNDFSLIVFELMPDRPTAVELIVNSTEELLARQAYGCGCCWLKSTGPTDWSL